PQGHEPVLARPAADLPAAAGAQLAQRPRRVVGRLPLRRAELPDRAPPLPDDAAPPSGDLRAPGAAALRRPGPPLRQPQHAAERRRLPGIAQSAGAIGYESLVQGPTYKVPGESRVSCLESRGGLPGDFRRDTHPCLSAAERPPGAGVPSLSSRVARV